MLTERKCTHNEETRSICGGYITTTEEKMEELNPAFDAYFYHGVMTLFEEAYDAAYKEAKRARAKQTGTDQEGS